MIALINDVIKSFSDVMLALLQLLPSSPFTWDLSSASGLMGWFDYFIPVSEIVTLVGSYVAVVAVWYMYRWGLRVIRFIE